MSYNSRFIYVYIKIDIEEIKKTEVQTNKMETKRENLTTVPSLTIIQILVSLYLIQKLIVGKVRHHQNIEKQHAYCLLLYLFTHSSVPTRHDYMSSMAGVL